MNRLLALAGLFSLAVVLSSSVLADDKDKKEDKPFTIKEIMKKSFGGKSNLSTEIKGAVKAKDWEKAEKVVAEWQKHAKDLSKNKPPKGEAESWEKLTGTFTKTLNTLGEAVKEKDDKKANGAIGAVSSSCKGCHSQHR